MICKDNFLIVIRSLAYLVEMCDLNATMWISF